MIKKPEDIKTVEDLEAEFNEVLLLADKGIIRILCANVVASRLDLDPAWLLIIAPPGGGKSEVLSTIEGLKFVHPLSDLTINTFMSGQKKTGKETSLLLRIGNGIITFKDFTGVLSKNKDAKKEIMGQLRQIYDGSYVKGTGTGENPTWRGKISIIGAVTEDVYKHLEDMSTMGERFVFYDFQQPDRKKASRKAMENAAFMAEKREHLKACMTAYISHVLETTIDVEIEMDEKTKEEIADIASFATIVRSGVSTDFRTGLIDFVPTKEMPTRVTKLLYTLAVGFVAMEKSRPGLKGPTKGKDTISEFDKSLLYKTAFDSIPRTKRDALFPLARYKLGITTAGLATEMSLPTPSVAKYLHQLNALGICKRIKKGGRGGDLWIMETEYRDLMHRFQGVKIEDKMLESMDSGDNLMDEYDLSRDSQKEKEEIDYLDKGLL